MFAREDKFTKIYADIKFTSESIETAFDNQNRFEFTKKLSSLYWLLGEMHFAEFHTTLNFLHLTHAELYYQTSVDTLACIQQKPSELLACGLFAVQKEKAFFANHSTSQEYVTAIDEYRVKERVQTQTAHYQDNPPSAHPIFHQPCVKRRKIELETTSDEMDIQTESYYFF